MWRIYRLRKTWVTFRLKVRDGGLNCSYCYCDFTEKGNRQCTIDHILALARGGSWRVSNLVFACAACNRQKGEALVSDFLWSKWLKLRRTVVEAEKQRGSHTSVTSVA